jgi:AraC-like DNA-binding protein
MEFYYSDHIDNITLPELTPFCIHLVCLEGEGCLVYFNHPFPFRKGDLLVLSHPDAISDLTLSPDCKGEFFAADYRFLQNLLPPNNYSIGGSISLHGNPVISLKEEQQCIILSDLQHIRSRMNESEKRFYREVMGSLCLTMMYDIFEFHSENVGEGKISERAGFIVGELMRLLSEGTSRTQREVSWYANQLHVSEKYLSATVKRMTGGSVMSYIDRHTIPILKEYLDNPSLSLTKIADLMNFTSLSYFSRYCAKHLGMCPTAYRANLISRVRGS